MLPAVLDTHVEEVRSGHTEEPEQAHPEAGGGAEAWDGVEELGARHPTAVLAWVAPDGFPLSARVPVRARKDRHRVAIDAPPAELLLLEAAGASPPTPTIPTSRGRRTSRCGATSCATRTGGRSSRIG